jgi:hypothetical protein
VEQASKAIRVLVGSKQEGLEKKKGAKQQSADWIGQGGGEKVELVVFCKWSKKNEVKQVSYNHLPDFIQSTEKGPAGTERVLCGATRKVLRGAPRPRWNYQDGGKQQPTTSKNGAPKPGLRNRSTKHQGTRKHVQITEAKERKRFCVENQGLGGTSGPHLGGTY